MSLMRRRHSGKDQRPVGPAGAKVLGWESAVVPEPERKLAGISSRAWVWMEGSQGPDHGEPCRPCTEFEFIRATVGSLWRAPDKGNLAHFASFSQRWQYPAWLYRADPKQGLSAAATGAAESFLLVPQGTKSCLIWKACPSTVASVTAPSTSHIVIINVIHAQ